jgi:hypothetical protein
MILIAPLAILGMLFFVAIGGAIVQQLWNWLLPSLFGWRQLTFWQALGLLALCRILFGGVGVGRSTRSGIRRRMAERWEHMTRRNENVSVKAFATGSDSVHRQARRMRNDHHWSRGTSEAIRSTA